MPRALGGDPVDPGGTDRIALGDRIGTRGTQRLAGLVGERDAGDLAEQAGHAVDVRLAHHALDPLAQRAPLGLDVIAFAHAGGTADRIGDHRERRAGAQRVAASDHELGALVTLQDPAHQLLSQTRLAGARRRGDQHHARQLLLDALGPQRLEGGELAIATDDRCCPAEQRSHRLGGVTHPTQEANVAVLDEREPGIEETRRDVIDDDLAGPGAAGHRDRAVDHVPREQAVERGPPRCDDDRRAGHHVAQCQRASRRAGRVIGGDLGVREEHERRAVGDPLEPATECGRRGRELVRLVRRAGEHHRDQALLRAGDRRAGRVAARGGRRRRQRDVCGVVERGTIVVRCIDDPGQRLRRGAAVHRAVGGLLRQHAQHERVEHRRDLGHQRARRRDVLEQDLREHRERLVAGEGRGAGQAAVQHAAEREDVAALVECGLAAHLLGSHVARRPDDGAGVGQESGLVDRARDAEVEHLDPLELAAKHHHVARLDIAMDHAALMSRGERVGDAMADHDRVGDAQPAAL
jgi:hypothetical protein